MTRRVGCQKATTELSLQNLQSLSHLRYPTDTRQLTSPQGEADGVSNGGMTLQALGGLNLPCGWYRIRGQLPSTRGREDTHTHTLATHGLEKPIFPVVLLCQFSVLAGKWFWFYILLMYLEYHTVVVLC